MVIKLFKHKNIIFCKHFFRNRRTDSTNSAEMTLESFIQSRQDERRVLHPHMGMRVPQYTAPPPPPGDN